MNPASINVLPALPKSLRGLLELALDLRWSTDPEFVSIWPLVDNDAWVKTGNPLAVLQAVPHARLEALAGDRSFRRLLRDRLATRAERLRGPAWFESRHGGDALTCAAYFCMEFGLGEALPMYAGGLGILAGDHLKACSDLGVPLLGVGLLYQRGYFRQAISELGSQVEIYPFSDPAQLPVIPARDKSGDWLAVAVDLAQGEVMLRVWEATVGRVRVFLLDTNHPHNGPADRGLAGELYGSGTETRLQQEILLGIGGWRALRGLGLDPQVCHLNEGHTAFACVERARCLGLDRGMPFSEALIAARPGNVFTTHTPVEAGFDRFPAGLIRQYLGAYVAGLGLEMDEFLALGRADPSSADEPFNMAHLALHTCGAANAVSRAHQAATRRLFTGIFPRTRELEVPIARVTNAVHVPSWLSPASHSFWRDRCCWDWGSEGREWTAAAGGAVAAGLASDEALWALRQENRRNLVEEVRAYAARHRGDPGRAAGDEGGRTPLLDPTFLTLGFARRFTGYKRCTLLLRDEDRLARMLSSKERPVQLVIAGKAHPADEEGRAMIHAWVLFSRRPDVHGRVVFVADYDIAVAASLVQGADVWINNPIRQLEASGTSGMKVLANGGLNLSEPDGWWEEAYGPEFGWSIGDSVPVGADHRARDECEAYELYSRLEEEIIPLFYLRDERGIPREWLRLVRSCMQVLAPRYSAGRMVSEYATDLYVPGARAYRSREAAGNGAAGEIGRWTERVRSCLEGVRFERVRILDEHEPRGVEVTLDPNGLADDFRAGTLAMELCSSFLELDRPVRAPVPLVSRSAGSLVFAAQFVPPRLLEHCVVRVVAAHPLSFGELETPEPVWVAGPCGV